MPEVSERVVEFAKNSFREYIQGLLDDPSCLIEDYRDEEPKEAINKLRQLASDLSIEFDALLVEVGHVNEVKRFKNIESGVIKPVPCRIYK